MPAHALHSPCSTTARIPLTQRRLDNLILMTCRSKLRRVYDASPTHNLHHHNLHNNYKLHITSQQLLHTTYKIPTLAPSLFSFGPWWLTLECVAAESPPRALETVTSRGSGGSRHSKLPSFPQTPRALCLPLWVQACCSSQSARRIVFHTVHSVPLQLFRSRVGLINLVNLVVMLSL